MRRLPVLLLLLLTACATGTRVPVRVLVYNIHAGKDAAGVDNLERVAGLIRSSDADLVLLQEVDRNTTRSGGVDQLAELMRLTGMHGVFGKSLDYQGGEYGIATLSRWPIVRHETVALHTDPPQLRAGGSLEPRIALIVETNRLHVLNTHLDASRDDRYRLQEIGQVIRATRNRTPILAGGDFNSEPESEVQKRVREAGLRDAWLECGAGPSLTYPASEPVKRIDYLFFTGRSDCTTAAVLDSQASDHRALLVTAVP
jgi:endonuclease/exonuclease/phosphatase family metal-dependent hydrolase